ncbi:MAG: hypothetical protein M1815_003068 [Lichina confinis]|nr:MAG: hypothetical protein M1815_003068 [Lichina confinis]
MASSTKTDQQDEQLQVKVLEFAEAFMSYDVDRLMGILSGDYRANDNPLGALNLDREAFRAHISDLYAATETLTVEPLSVQGSCAPGSFAVLEWVLTFKLEGKVPTALAPHFPPDVPAGGEAKWVGVSLLWWNEEGKIKIQKDHGRYVWEGFDMEEAKKVN